MIDLGPGAGPHGGRVVATGSPRQVARAKESVTGQWLRGEGEHPPWPRRSLKTAERLAVVGARLHNLRDLSVEVPARPPHRRDRRLRLRQVHPRARRPLPRGEGPPRRQAPAAGARGSSRASAASPGPSRWTSRRSAARPARSPRPTSGSWTRSARSSRRCPTPGPSATAASRFSFNVKGGRCERCEGQGRLRVTMALLPDVYVPCESCRGRRYNADTQAVLFKGKSVADVLEMTIDEAREHFSAVGAIRRPLEFLSEIGLGYLAARPALAHPLRRRGPAHQARRRADLARLRPVALRPRRADDRPAHGRRGAARDLAPAPGRPRRHRGRHRAQPRPDRGRRLRDRPRARRAARRAAASWPGARRSRWRARRPRAPRPTCGRTSSGRGLIGPAVLNCRRDRTAPLRSRDRCSHRVRDPLRLARARVPARSRRRSPRPFCARVTVVDKPASGIWWPTRTESSTPPGSTPSRRRNSATSSTSAIS